MPNTAKQSGHVGASSPADSADTFVDWFYELIGEVSSSCGLTERQSAQVVQVIIDRVQAEYGGGRLYVHSQSNTENVRQLWREGNTLTDISQQLGLSYSWVRRIVKNMPESKETG